MVALALVLGLAACTAPTPAPSLTPTVLRDVAAQTGIAIGTAINVDLLDNPTYAGLAATQFNSVTAENAMKWEQIEPTQGMYNWAPADRLVEFAAAHGQTVRGHTLIWHSQTPAWLAGVAAHLSDAEFADLVKRHVSDEVAHFAGKIWQWDVVNEAFDDGGGLRDTIFRQRLGDDYIAQVFQWAHEADPTALLFYNDYGLEYGGSKAKAVLTMVTDLKARGIPIAGVGFQAHYETTAPVPSGLAGVMAQFTALGLVVAVTEMDVRGSNPTYVASYYTTTLNACRGVHACISFTVWGISDKDSWIPQAFPGLTPYCLYDATYRPHPWYADLAAALG